MEIITITPEREHFSTFFQWIGCVTITGFWRFRMHRYLYFSSYFKTWLILQCLHLQAILYISVTLHATSMQHYWLDAIVCFATGYICNFWFLLQALGVFCRLLFASDSGCFISLNRLIFKVSVYLLLQSVFNCLPAAYFSSQLLPFGYFPAASSIGFSFFLWSCCSTSYILHRAVFS